MKIYYAHSKMIYNTPREKQELKWLRKRYEIVEPNNDIGELGSIEPYLKAVSKCEGVICSEYEGHVGYGVYQEIGYALEHKLPVWVLRKNFIGNYLKVVKGLQMVDETRWKIYYAKLIVSSEKVNDVLPQKKNLLGKQKST